MNIKNVIDGTDVSRDKVIMVPDYVMFSVLNHVNQTSFPASLDLYYLGIRGAFNVDPY